MIGKKKNCAEVASQELERIDDFLEANYSQEAQRLILPSIENGRVWLDENQKRVIVKLQRPIESGEKLINELKIGYLTPYDCSQIDNKTKLRANKAGEVDIPVGFQDEKTFRLISAATGVPLGVIQRVGRYDFNDLQNLLSFLL